jgi:hypothetical protein
MTETVAICKPLAQQVVAKENRNSKGKSGGGRVWGEKISEF